MIEQIIDLHIHSKYSRACSPALELPNIARACEGKGIDIVSTGDFTHPLWFRHLEENLVEENSGIFKVKGLASKTRFILGTEISCIYKHKDKTRRIHLLIFAPSFEAVRKFNTELEKRKVNLKADGRPIMGLSAKTIVQICLDIDPTMMIIPAHAWTPWFAVFGSKSGYNSLEECFEEITPEIFAIETGLSSDPPMNHRLTQLDRITLISNSDAHSLDNLGREANVFQFESEKEITYQEIRRVLKEQDKEKFLYTIEFYPEEGKYHCDGHAACGVRLSPPESKREKLLCPKCKKPLTIGVLHRVDDLADRAEDSISMEKFVPHRYIVPLAEIIGRSFEVGVKSKKVVEEYRRMTKSLGSEFHILLHASLSDIERAVSDKNVALGIRHMREGKVKISPGYDGVYGVVDVFPEAKPSGPKQTQLL
ncbi:MAG TPA: endonuclease Q family protein [Patescibacteria group bacterium]|nr:endonuclease Q family protein [Patescibacteria group bacterium]